MYGRTGRFCYRKTWAQEKMARYFKNFQLADVSLSLKENILEVSDTVEINYWFIPMNLGGDL